MLSVVLFGAMGLLFVVGYGVAAGRAGSLLARLKPRHLLPGFNETVFIAFALASFLLQTVFFQSQVVGGPLDALQSAVAFAVPGQTGLGYALAACGVGGGSMVASAFAWLLAFVYLGSSLSRIRLAAGIVRLERKDNPAPLTPAGTALLLGAAAIAGIQLLYIGSLYPLLPCHILRGIVGDMLVGLAPLMLAYLILAALTNLLAMGPEA